MLSYYSQCYGTNPGLGFFSLYRSASPRIEREIIMLLEASVTEASDPPLNYWRSESGED